MAKLTKKQAMEIILILKEGPKALLKEAGAFHINYSKKTEYVNNLNALLKEYDNEYKRVSQLEGDICKNERNQDVDAYRYVQHLLLGMQKKYGVSEIITKFLNKEIKTHFHDDYNLYLEVSPNLNATKESIDEAITTRLKTVKTDVRKKVFADLNPEYFATMTKEQVIELINYKIKEYENLKEGLTLHGYTVIDEKTKNKENYIPLRDRLTNLLNDYKNLLDEVKDLDEEEFLKIPAANIAKTILEVIPRKPDNKVSNLLGFTNVTDLPEYFFKVGNYNSSFSKIIQDPKISEEEINELFKQRKENENKIKSYDK